MDGRLCLCLHAHCCVMSKVRDMTRDDISGDMMSMSRLRACRVAVSYDVLSVCMTLVHTAGVGGGSGAVAVAASGST